MLFPVGTNWLMAALALMLLIGRASAFRDPAGCPRQCLCTEIEMICSCDGGDFVLRGIPAHRQTLTISNCGQVRILGNPFNQRSFDRVALRDISDLVIANVNFLGVRSIRRLMLSNIANLTLGMLSSLRSDSFEMRNVTIHKLQQSVLAGITDIREVRISDSRIGTIEKGALHFQHEDLLEIIDSTIAFVDSESICVDQVETFLLQGCQILHLAENALNIMHVDKVSVIRNTIGTVNEGGFLVEHVKELIFIHNDFKRIEFNAFYHMQEVAKFTMTENRFRHVDRHGLLLFLKVEDPLVVIERNHFSCDCSLTWLWEEHGFHKFDKFFNSTCFAPDRLAGLAINEVSPKISRRDDLCVTVEPIRKDSGRMSEDQWAAVAPVDGNTLLWLSSAQSSTSVSSVALVVSAVSAALLASAFPMY